MNPRYQKSYGIVQGRTAKIRTRSLSVDNLFINDCGFTWGKANNEGLAKKGRKKLSTNPQSNKKLTILNVNARSI